MSDEIITFPSEIWINLVAAKELETPNTSILAPVSNVPMIDQAPGASMRYVLDSNTWIPVADMPDEWRDGRILEVDHPRFGRAFAKDFGHFERGIFQSTHAPITIEADYVRLPSEGPKR